MTIETSADRASVAKTAWERPALVRLDAADAEMMNPGPTPEGRRMDVVS